MNALESLLIKTFDIHILNSYDLIIKPKNNNEDKWLRIKLRIISTRCDLTDQFEDYLLIINSTYFNKYYLIPREVFLKYTTIVIGKKLSKYNCYKLENNEDLCSNILKYFENIKLYPYEIAKSNKLLQVVTSNPNVKYTFKNICDLVEERKCKVISKEANYVNTKGPITIRYLCGHEANTTYNQFMRKTVFICTQCSDDNARVNNYNHDTNSTLYSFKESQLFDKIKNILIDFDVIKTNEACRSDMIIRPKDILDNIWIPIQLKGSYIDNIQYTFKTKGKSYNNMIVICNAEKDNRYWIFNGTLVTPLKSLTIGKKLSKYSKFEVDSKNISTLLTNVYNTKLYNDLPINLDTKEYFLTPSGEKNIMEHTYRIRREKMIGSLVKIEYPKIDNTKTDCIINGYKIQDKLSRQDTRANTEDLFKVEFPQIYKIGDNNLYWFHFSVEKYTNISIILPESYLISEGYFDKDRYLKNYISFYMNNNKFKDYVFKYDDFDVEKFNKLCIT